MGRLSDPPASRRRALLLLSLGLLALHLYASLRGGLAASIALPPASLDLRVHSVVLLAFSLAHATWLLGLAESAQLFVLGTVVSWAFEQTGVATGLVYGSYRYTDALGPRLGHVPILVPLAWFMMIYPSLVLARVAVDGHAEGRVRGAGRIAATALVAALVVTAWDLALDPRMTELGQWVWLEPGRYFGVPLHNYAGWLVTTATIYGLHLGLAQRLRVTAARGRRARDVLPPLVAYGGMMAFYVLDAAHPALRLIAAFAMGTPLAIASARLATAGAMSRAEDPRADAGTPGDR